jgi:hypothetical protein
LQDIMATADTLRKMHKNIPRVLNRSQLDELREANLNR